jgi:hypothetical protein
MLPVEARGAYAGDAAPFNGRAVIVKLFGMAMMKTCGFVAALGTAFLLSRPAFCADQEDWARCRGDDPIPAIAACSSIVSDQNETAQNRAEAYWRRAAAHLDHGDIDAAIADNGEAIQRAPFEIDAYFNRALAYFRNGDNDRAVIDFAVAERLDTTRTDAAAAANPALARIAAMARGALPAALGAKITGAKVTAPAGPFCPSGETARNGFVLVDRQKARRQQVRPSNGDVATYDYFEGGARAMSATYYKGLLILFASFLDTYINSYDIDYSRLGVFRVGQESLYHVSHMTLDGKVTGATVERQVVGAEKLSIGDCTFDTFVIESHTLFADGTTTAARSNFSPELKMSLHLITNSAGMQPYEVSFDAIEPLPRPLQ